MSIPEPDGRAETTGAQEHTGERAPAPGAAAGQAAQKPSTRRRGRSAQPTAVTPSRLGGMWTALTSGAIVLLLLLIFILENGRSVDIVYFGAHGHLPLGVALLLAAILGVLLVLIPGGGRMLQLRRAARRHAARAAEQPTNPPTAPHEEQAQPHQHDTAAPGS